MLVYLFSICAQKKEKIVGAMSSQYFIFVISDHVIRPREDNLRKFFQTYGVALKSENPSGY